MRRARSTARWLALAWMGAGLALSIGCSRPRETTIAAAPEPSTPKSAKPPPPDFDAALREVQKLTGGAPAAPPAGPPSSRDLVLFEVQGSPNAGLELVEEHGARLRAMGAYFFLYDHGYGNGPDVVGLARTTDKLELVKMVGSTAINYGHDNAAVVSWLRALDHDEPFVLTGAGHDFVEGSFVGAVHDPASLAKRVNTFCPDFYEQGLSFEEEGPPEEVITRWFSKKRTFFFWWD